LSTSVRSISHDSPVIQWSVSEKHIYHDGAYDVFTVVRLVHAKMARMRKSAVQIRFEILEYLFFNAKTQPRTAVWRKSTNLSYDDFLKHLAYLEEKKLVIETAGGCALTDEGRKLYVELRKSMPSIL
jgi:predicted transcriptional regulator